MVYYRRKRTMKKRGMRRPLRRFSRKPTTRGLAKRVAGISRTLRKATEWSDWTQERLGVDAVAPFQQFHINNYSTWLPTFLNGMSSATSQGTLQEVTWVNSKLTMDFNLKADYANITYTVFLVQLKDQFRNNQYDDTTGTITLTAGVHYNSTEGMTMLNKRFFVIRGVRKFTLGNFGVNPATVGDAGGSIDDYKRITFALRPNKKVIRQEAGRRLIGFVGTPAQEALPDPDPSKNYYVLVFNNDASATEAQKINYRAQHVCKSY